MRLDASRIGETREALGDHRGIVFPRDAERVSGMELGPEAVDDPGGATMNPNPLLDPLLGTTVEAHQQELLEAARVTWVSARTGTGDVPGARGACSRRFMWRTPATLVTHSTPPFTRA